MKNRFNKVRLSSVAAAGVLNFESACAATFGDDVDFLKKHVDVIVLADRTGQGKAAIVPAFQGRVMTTTAQGDSGLSFGWINRELISGGKPTPHINVYGGEDRFWLGPEGGQFSIFFSKGASFELANWFTPPSIDTIPYKVLGQDRSRAHFEHSMTLTNYSGTVFNLRVDREVHLLDRLHAWSKLGLKMIPRTSIVAVESVNKVINTGSDAWAKDTGLLSIWILGMFNPSSSTTIVVPIETGTDSELGAKVTSNYFGEVPPNRLVVGERALFFSGDGKFRSKIGINPRRSKAVLGSYDAANKVLTIVQFTQPKGVTDYVNSLWRLQENPFQGDAANSYNDGPPQPGAKPLGPFYELESSSPAAALKPKQILEHVHRTLHITGAESALNAIAQTILGVTLVEIQKALPTN